MSEIRARPPASTALAPADGERRTSPTRQAPARFQYALSDQETAMPNDKSMSRDAGSALSWGSGAASMEEGDVLGTVAWWLSGGASLLLWTGIALLLTSA
jgi:hypothetical protein